MDSSLKAEFGIPMTKKGWLIKDANNLQMWSSLIAKAKLGGIDVIQTYVFWNLHESQQGQVTHLN